MASITSAQSGLSTATSTWVGGVVPVVGDKVTIAAGHTVTLAGTHTWGDDTSTGITVNGTLKASRTVSSQLTCRGDLFCENGGTIDLGTEADPVSAGVTTTVVINDSAAMAHNKWGVRTNSTAPGFGAISVWGAQKTGDTVLTSNVLATDVVMPVADATGWAVGDVLGFAALGSTAVVYRAVTGVAPTGGTAANVTVGANLGRSGSVGDGVLNITRNVRVIGSLPQTWRTHVSILVHGTAAARLELGPCTITAAGGGSTNDKLGGLNIQYVGGSTYSDFVKKVNGPVVTSVVSVSGSSVVAVASGATRNLVNCFSGQAAPYRLERIYAAALQNDGLGIAVRSGASVSFGPASAILGSGNAFDTSNSQGGVDCVYEGRIWSCDRVLNGNAVSITFKGAALRSYRDLASASAGGSLVFDGCQVTGPTVAGHATSFPSGALFSTALKSCTLSGFTISRALSGLSAVHPAHALVLQQVNGDAATNERYTRSGRVHRDGTRTRRSTGSICLASWYSANVLSMPLSTKVAAGATLRIKGSVWIEAAYLPGDAPAISLSGTGLTTVNWSAPSVSDQWHEFDLQITNTNAYPTDVAITLTARSNANTETARVWFDGLFSDPWSGSVRHHGFQWLAQTALVADTRITLTEAAAQALPVAVNHVAQTIAVTGVVTARQVFEAAMADLVQTANQTRAVHISSATGDSFETTYTVVTSGAGAITGVYVDATGRHVTLSAPALVSGSLVQVYNLTTSTQLFLGTLSSTGLTLPLTWTADYTLRIRAEHSTKLALETVTVLTSAGATVLDSQVEDTRYIENGIDGTTVTELSADLPSIQIDINDADGELDIWRLYAWAQAFQNTPAGIVSDFFGAITSPDEATVVIDQAKANIKLDNVGTGPVRVVGGYLSRKDGSTVIAAGSGSIQMDPGKAYVAGANGMARESTVQTVLALSLG